MEHPTGEDAAEYAYGSGRMNADRLELPVGDLSDTRGCLHREDVCCERLGP